MSLDHRATGIRTLSGESGPARRVLGTRSGHLVQCKSWKDLQPGLASREDERNSNRHATSALQDLREWHRGLSERNNLRRLRRPVHAWTLPEPRHQNSFSYSHRAVASWEGMPKSHISSHASVVPYSSYERLL